MKPLHILFWLAVSAPLLALIPYDQDPAATDWSKEVDVACNAKRYGMRLSAAKKIAGAGAAAVPAIHAFVGKHGANTLPVALVEEIANHDGTDAAVVELLLGWAADREFYWRAQAMKGLALRAPLMPDRQPALRGLFATHGEDAAWLMRVHARLGAALLANVGGAAAPADADPRAAPRLCALLLQYGRTPDLQPLFDALFDERTFQGVPWGQHRANDAFKAIKGWLGDADPFKDGKAIEDKPAAVEALLAAARTKSGQPLKAPASLRDERTFAGGIEVLSCKSGDLFLQWTADGELSFGLTGATTVKLPAPVWDALSRERAALQLDTNHGVVICDSMRLCWTEPAVHTKVAPGALPAAAAKWLASLANALQEADQPRLAEALRASLGQFGPP